MVVPPTHLNHADCMCGAVVGTGRGCWNGNAASMVVRSQGCFPFVFVSVWGFASLCWVCKGAGANSAPALLGVVSPFISKGWRLLCPDFAFGGVRFPVLVVLGWLGARSSVHVSLSQSVARSNELLFAFLDRSVATARYIHPHPRAQCTHARTPAHIVHKALFQWLLP